MQKITSEVQLRDAIELLEIRRTGQEKALREELQRTYESIRPVNLIKSTYKEIKGSEEIKNNLITASVGLAAAYISTKLVEKFSHSPVKKLIGQAILLGITTAVRENPDAVKTLAIKLFGAIRSRFGTKTVQASVTIIDVRRERRLDSKTV